MSDNQYLQETQEGAMKMMLDTNLSVEDRFSAMFVALVAVELQNNQDKQDNNNITNK